MGWRWDVLARLIRECGLERGAEIGVADGRCTQRLLSAIPDLHLIAVDCWPDGYLTHSGDCWSRDFQDSNRERFNAVMERFPGRLRLIEKPSLGAAVDVPDASLDFVFIDADHRYNAVKGDIAAWTPKVRPKGFVTGHDYDIERFPDVVRAVNETGWPVTLHEDFVWTVHKP